MRKVLLDTNLIIRVFDTQTTDAPELVRAAKASLKALLSSGEVAFAITPLVYFEALRGIEHGNTGRTARLKEAMSQFEMIDIRQADADLAARLTQFAESNNSSLKRKNFDVLHFACAQVNGLSIESADSDLTRVSNLYQAMKQQELANAKT